MTRPTRPPGQPYPDDEEPPEAGQPRFTPRQSGPQPPYEPPTLPGAASALPGRAAAGAATSGPAAFIDWL